MDNGFCDGISHVVSVNSDENRGCEYCGDFRIGGNGFAASVNHYIEDHGYRLLHLGQQTDTDYQGRPFQMTVAILGK